MQLPEFAVNRRVSTAMIAMILVVVGGISFTRLGLDLFPDLEFPTVSVITTYRGAAPEDIENSITEAHRAGRQLGQRGQEGHFDRRPKGRPTIQVEFEWGTNLDFAAQDLRDQIGLYKAYLPTAASDPLVVKFNMSQIPVIFWGVTGNRPSAELKNLVEDEVARRFERLDGVAAATAFSMDTREILVDVDKNALADLGLSFDRVLGALMVGQPEHAGRPSGRTALGLPRPDDRANSPRWTTSATRSSGRRPRASRFMSGTWPRSRTR